MSFASTRLHEHRMSALRQANQVRGLRAKLKQDLREGTVRLEQILATSADYLASAEIFDLLVAVPKIGPVKAARLLTIARISPSTTVAALSERAARPPNRAAQPLAMRRTRPAGQRGPGGAPVAYESGSIVSAAVRIQVA